MKTRELPSVQLREFTLEVRNHWCLKVEVSKIRIHKIKKSLIY